MTSQLWRDHVNISYSLDIDFIHGDIHSRLCKKYATISLIVTPQAPGQWQYCLKTCEVVPMGMG